MKFLFGQDSRAPNQKVIQSVILIKSNVKEEMFLTKRSRARYKKTYL